MKTIGEKIKSRRVELGLTQKELSDRSGLSIRSITSIEAGITTPRSSTMRKLCESLDISEAYLLHPEIEDPSYGMDVSPFVDSVRNRFGRRAGNDFEDLLEANRALFAGGDIPQEDKDKFFAAVAAAYSMAKEEASKTFTPKRHKK